MIKKHFTLPQYMALVFGLLALPVIYLISRHNYNLFHSLADGVSIVIAASAFTVIWNSRRLVDNNYFLFAGIGFLFFAFLDLLHVLSNKDMGVFPSYGNLGPALYIASRYVLSISLLAASLFINRKLNTALTFAVYSLVTSLIMLSIFHWQIFPVCIVEGAGLTPFKVISDYIICLILSAAIALLLRNRKSFDARVLRIIVCSLILSIATGLTFTLYADPFGITNMFGHLFQIASFYLVYLAIIETGLTKPQEILFRKLKLSEATLSENLKQLDHTNIALKQEIAEREQAEGALRESETKYRTLFENMKEEVLFWKLVRDEQGRIQTWRLVDANPPTLKTWGMTRENILGRTTDEIFGPGAAEHYMPVVQKIFIEGTPYSSVDHFPHLDKYFRFTSVPLGEYFITTGADITDIKKAHEEIERLNNDLRAKNERLEFANKDLEAFGYTVSHDLHAPLRHMSGFSGLLSERLADYPDEKVHHYIDVIVKSAQKMGTLIDDLLAFSRLGRADIQKKKVSLNDLVKISIMEIKEEEGRDITWEIGEMPDVYGDQSMLRVVLNNLIRNAVKFSRTRARAEVQIGEKQERDEWVIFVQDNGVGFNMQYAHNLFGVFQRLHAQDEFEGSGIGLATVGRIVARHGGKTWAEGSEGQGATFYFSLPKIKEA